LENVEIVETSGQKSFFPMVTMLSDTLAAALEHNLGDTVLKIKPARDRKAVQT
jgi:hypothetical protein